ncbi:CP2 transcription factor-domain-containing protein [Sporodiniella umbellata]|nr:CP2 transcription factor-domain-containing protein [Sporodiniella umbellata]
MKSEHQKPITYLNRGQTYLLELNSNNPERGTLTSTLSIAFHEHDHRKVASGYWKFWLSQQLEPQKARAIDLDEHQTTGIYNIRYDTFDKITFDWHGRLGAKIYVRFHCLSTDFSRIKGVKGIPMRANIETRTRYAQLPEHSHDYSGHFVQKENDTHFIHHQPNYYEYVEKSFCQMKLFRDKGAERKNKDDAKQIHKQLQKATALTMNNAQQHPSWSILNQPYKPVTLLNQIPQSPEEELLMDPLDPESNYPPELIDALHVPLQETGKKRKRVMVNTTTLTTTANEPNEFALFEPNTTATLNKRWPSPSHGLEFFLCSKHSFPTLQERITLETLTKEHLRLKLATALSLYPQRVTEVLWKKKKKTVDDETFMLVDDPLIAENIVQGETVWIECEMKPDSSVRLVLEFNSRFNNP